MIGLAYVLLNQTIKTVYDPLYNDSSMQDQDTQTFLVRAKTIWSWVLVPSAFGLLLWAVLEIQRRKSEYGD